MEAIFNHKQLVKEYIDGMSSIKLAKKYNCSTNTIFYALKKFGIKPRTLRETKIGNKNWLGKKHSEKTKELQRNAHLGEKNPMYGIKLIGEKNGNWKGGITHEDVKIRKSDKYSNWRKKCMERDDYTCQISNERGGNLCVHHLDCFSDYRDERFNIKNGITIKKSIHTTFHNLFGKCHNTKEQFNEFIKNGGKVNE